MSSSLLSVLLNQQPHGVSSVAVSSLADLLGGASATAAAAAREQAKKDEAFKTPIGQLRWYIKHESVEELEKFLSSSTVVVKDVINFAESGEHSNPKGGSIAYAILNGVDVEKLDVLIKHGADVNLKSFVGRSRSPAWSPLAQAVAMSVISTTPLIGYIATLADAGAKVFGQTIKFEDRDYSLFEFAVRNSASDDTAVIEFLQSHAIKNHYKWDLESHSPSLLHLAVHRNQPQTVKFLLSIGADVDRKDSRGTSPLHVAALKSFASIGYLLAATGGNIHLANDVSIGNPNPFQLSPLELSHCHTQRSLRQGAAYFAIRQRIAKRENEAEVAAAERVIDCLTLGTTVRNDDGVTVEDAV